MSEPTVVSWLQPVPIRENSVYEFSGHIKTENVSSIARFSIIVLDESGQEVTLGPGFTNGPNPYTHNEYSGSTGWTEDMIRFTAPRGSAWAAVALTLRAEGSGRVWFDDMYFGTPDPSAVEIDVSASSVIGEIRSLQGVHGADGNLVSPFKKIGVDLARNHDSRECDVNTIFPDSAADENLEGSYRFEDADQFIQIVYASGAEPFFRIGYSWGGPNSPPADYAKWAQIAKHIVMHYNAGWADGFYLGIRYWEIWNEPDFRQFWVGSEEQFYELYETVAGTLKAYDPALMVGGAGFAGTAWREGFLSHCQLNGVPLDFFSWHLYSPHPSQFLLIDAELRDALESHGFSDTESVQSEWNMYASGFIPEMIDAEGAAYTATALMYMQDTTISRAARYNGEADSETMSLFNSDYTLKKPAYAFKAMKMMLATPVRLAASGSDTLGYAVLAGKSESGDMMQIMISDYNSGHAGYVIHAAPGFGSASFRYKRYLLDDGHDLELVGDEIRTTADISEEMTSPSVQLVRMTAQNYINLEASPETVGPGEKVTLSWDCDFSRWEWEGEAVDVYLAAIRDPAVADGPSSLAGAAGGGTIWLAGPGMGSVSTPAGSVPEPTFANVSFPPAPVSGSFELSVPDDPAYAGEYAFATVFISAGAGTFIRPDGLPVENSNIFSIQ